MNRVICDMSVSLDGYVTGPNQSAELPFGEGVDGRLHGPSSPTASNRRWPKRARRPAPMGGSLSLAALRDVRCQRVG